MLLSVCTHSQTFKSKAINSTGTNITASNAQIEFSVGDVVIETQNDSGGNSISPGFINSITGSSSITHIHEIKNNNLDVRIFPNPTCNWLNIRFNDGKVTDVNFQLVDIKGNIIREFENVRGNHIMIDTSTLACGTYIMNVSCGQNKNWDSYRIVKSNNK